MKFFERLATEVIACLLGNISEPRLFSERDRLKKPTDPNSRSAQADAKWEATPADPYGDAGDGVVKVPKIYWDYTTKGVLTMEWIEGIKLTDRESLLAAKLDIRHLVDQVSTLSDF